MQVSPVSDEALEALSSSLGKREPDPDEKKPAVDKVKVEKTIRPRKIDCWCYYLQHYSISSGHKQSRHYIFTLFKNKMYSWKQFCSA